MQKSSKKELMNNIPDVSIILINYNKPELTKDCILSIFEHTQKVNFEIIVVDNASTKGNIDNIAGVDPRVRLIKSPENLGFAKGNNLGIKYANGNTILLLNNDTLLINDAISIAYDFLHSKPNAAVVSARLQYPDGAIQYCAQPLPKIKFLLIELFRLQKLMSAKIREKLLLGTFFDHNRNIKAGWVWGTFFMFKKELLEKLPEQKLADDFFMYNEDMQWGIETKRAGYETWFCTDARVIHLEGQNSFKGEMANKNFDTLMDKYYGAFYYGWYKRIKKLITLSSK